jgi:uncharacterized protein YkwD
MRFLAALIVMSTAALMSSTAATPSAPTKLERRAALEAAVVHELNRVRVQKGLRPLRAAPSLRTAARAHSEAMLAYGFFDHDSADGTAFSDRIRRYYTNRGWTTWSVGEALLASQNSSVDPKAVVAAWLDSPPHRAIILSPAWRDAGIGVLYAPTAPREFRGSETIVVTADFGFREGRASSL